MKAIAAASFGMVLLLASHSTYATPVLYTFESPNFMVGQTTPLLNIAPNVNPDGPFTASFIDAATPSAFQVQTDSVFQPNGLMVGQYLYLPALADTLTITLSHPVDQVTLDFALDIFNGSPAGELQFVSAAGSVDQASSNQSGGMYQGGILTFTSGTPFSSFTLDGLQATGAPINFAIDNLQLDTPVPEPASMLLLGIGLIGFGARRWRTRRHRS